MAEERTEQSGGGEERESAPRPPRRFGGGGGGGRSFPRRKVCGFCVDGIKHVDYKDVPRMRRYISDRGMIEPRRKTGTCAKHQRSLTTAIKRARHLALLSFTEGGREPRDRGGRDRDRGPRGGGRFGRDRFEGGDRPRFEGGDRPRFEGGDRGGDRPRFESDRGEQRAPQPPATDTGSSE